MLVRGVPVKKLVLHEASQLPEFRHIFSQKIHLMHHPKNVSDLTFPGQNGLERFAGGPGILKSAIDQPGPPANQLLEFRTEFQFALLRVKKDADQAKGIFVKDFRIFGIDESAVTVKSVKLFGFQFALRQKPKDRLLLFLADIW